MSQPTDNLIDDELLTKLLYNCERNEIRLQEEACVVGWARAIILRYELLESIRKGHIEVYAVENDEPLFRITPAGQEALKQDQEARKWIADHS